MEFKPIYRWMVGNSEGIWGECKGEPGKDDGGLNLGMNHL